MAYRNLFIQTGQTPPRGFTAPAELIRPSKHNEKYNGATVFVTGNPYRRVYRDSEGFYVNRYGNKCRVFQIENS